MNGVNMRPASNGYSNSKVGDGIYQKIYPDPEYAEISKNSKANAKISKQ